MSEQIARNPVKPKSGATVRQPAVSPRHINQQPSVAALSPAILVGRNLTPRGTTAARAKSWTNRPDSTPTPSADTPHDQHKPRVAIVHDWLIGGGAELIVEQLHELYPEAPIYTSYCTKEWRSRLDNKVKTGFLQWWPLGALRKFLPLLRIWWFTHLDLSSYDVVVSSSGAEAKGVHIAPTAVHINYCHAPTHYYWSRYEQYLARPGFGRLDWLARIGLKTLVGPLRKWDYRAAQRPDYIIANSNHIRSEIQKYYDRSATVIYPPVDTERLTSKLSDKTRKGFIIAGRQTPYKRFDLAVATCSKLQLPLTVIGTGPEHRRLRHMAGPSITFLGKVTDEVLAVELSQAKALLFPGTDDFGIIAVEAMAAGTPVIAYAQGGALEYVVPGKTGILFEEQTAMSLAKALKGFSTQQFNAADIARFANRFSRQQFKRKMRLLVTKAVKKANE